MGKSRRYSSDASKAVAIPDERARIVSLLQMGITQVSGFSTAEVMSSQAGSCPHGNIRVEQPFDDSISILLHASELV